MVYTALAKTGVTATVTAVGLSMHAKVGTSDTGVGGNSWSAKGSSDCNSWSAKANSSYNSFPSKENSSRNSWSNQWQNKETGADALHKETMQQLLMWK
jgi:hypothetical protein